MTNTPKWSTNKIKITRSLPPPLDEPMDELPEYHCSMNDVYQAIQELIKRQNAIIEILQKMDGR